MRSTIKWGYSDYTMMSLKLNLSTIIICLCTICCKATVSSPPNSPDMEIRILAPQNNSIVSDKINISVELENIGSYKYVEIFFDNKKIHTFDSDTLEFLWETKYYINGNHALFCHCVLLEGDTIKSEMVNFNIQNLSNYNTQNISFINHNNYELQGTLFSVDSSEIAILTGHSFVAGEDQSGLVPMATKLAEHGFTVMTFDFQGRGISPGPTAYGEVYLDVQDAINYLVNNGYNKIACLGIGLGGLGCAKMAPNFEGLITISIPLFIPEHPTITTADLAKPYPKLFIAAKADSANGRPFATRAKELYDMSVEPRALMLLSGSYHSMQLFSSPYKSKIETAIIELFLSLK